MRATWKDIADFTGTIAVVVSLVYVGVQIQQNTAAVQTATSHGALTLAQDQLGRFVEDPELAGLLMRAYGDSLDAQDGVRWSMHLTQRLNFFEFVYQSRSHGTMDDGLAASWLRSMNGFLCTPGVQPLWTATRATYTEDFANFVDERVASATCS